MFFPLSPYDVVVRVALKEIWKGIEYRISEILDLKRFEKEFKVIFDRRICTLER
jgi:hypothetical protein